MYQHDRYWWQPEPKDNAVSKSKLNGGVRPDCCYNCKYMGYIAGSMGQPHLEFWCKKDACHGMEDKETLFLKTDFKLHKRTV